MRGKKQINGARPEWRDGYRTRTWEESHRLRVNRGKEVAHIIAALPKVHDQVETAKLLCISRQAVAQGERKAIWKIAAALRLAAAQLAQASENFHKFEQQP